MLLYNYKYVSNLTTSRKLKPSSRLHSCCLWTTVRGPSNATLFYVTYITMYSFTAIVARHNNRCLPIALKPSDCWRVFALLQKVSNGRLFRVKLASYSSFGKRSCCSRSSPYSKFALTVIENSNRHVHRGGK